MSIFNFNLRDTGKITFGTDNEIELGHVHDTGLTLKHTATADDKPIILTLATGETDIAADDVIGTINFQAPYESSGTDAIEVCAGIEAVAEGVFAENNNATKLSFKTGASEAATEKMSLSSGGNLTINNGTLTAATGSTIGNLTLANGSITDSSGTISFGDENLTTTGILTAATGSTIGNLTLANGSITDSSGTISFGNEALTTTGILTAASGSSIGNLTLANGSITDSSGAISFGNEALTTTGTITVARTSNSVTTAAITASQSGYGMFMDGSIESGVGPRGYIGFYNGGIAKNPAFIELNWIGPTMKINGNIQYTGTISDVSDDRLKENEVLITDAVTTIQKLRPQIYDKKTTFTNTDTTTWDQESGLIAQEVYYDATELRHLVIVPDGVTPDENITTSTDPSDDPDYSSWGDEPASINYIGVIPYLVKSIQELKDTIDSQSATITNLTTRITALENP